MEAGEGRGILRSLGPFSCPYSPKCVERDSANFALTGFSDVSIAPVPPLASYGRMPRLPCLIPGSAQSRLLLFHLL